MTLSNYIKYGTLMLTAALAGCESIIQPPEEIQQEISTAVKQLETQTQQPPALPAGVMSELMASEQSQVMGLGSQLRFSIAADQVEAGAFFASLVEGTPYSIAIHPGVQGTITLNLQNVTLAEAMDVVQSMYGYDVQQTNNLIQIFPAELRTETFAVDYLMLSRVGRSRTTINSSSLVDADENNSNSSNSSSDSSSNTSSESEGSNSNTGTVINTESESDFWPELENSVRLMVGSELGRSVISSPQSGLLTVKAMPKELAQIRHYLQRLQTRVQRQVLLEAKILEVSLSDGYQQGINWDALASGTAGFSGGFSQITPTNDISSTIGGVFSLGYKSSNFNAAISLLKTQGNVNVLSSPRISASNNQKAVIKVGTDEYFVTDVSTTTVTGTSTSTTPEVELTPFFEGIALDVTPQIDDLGAVLLHVHPSVTDINEQTKVISIFEQQLALPLAQSDIRETDTIVRANSGDVVVIGGLMSTTHEQIDSKVPFLGDLPLLGGFFTNISDIEHKTELVIMIKPTIIETQHGLPELKKSRQTINKWYQEAQRRFD